MLDSRPMDPLVQRAIDAIEAAERDVASLPPIVLSTDYLADVERVMAPPENRPGADKTIVWHRYAALRRHFRAVHPLPR